MNKLKTTAGVKDPYTKRILSNVVGLDALKVIAETPGKLKRLVIGLTDKQVRTPPSRGKWSIAEIIAHMTDVEVVFAFRLRMAVAQSGSRLQAMDENQWATGLNYKEVDWERKFGVLAMVRADHVAFLKSLSPAQLRRYGVHEERGKETITRMVQMYAGHDINHLKQIEQIRNLFLEKN